MVRIDKALDRPFQLVMPANVLAHREPTSQTIDRFETSITYKPVKFRDPDETLMLPQSVRTLSVIYNGGVPRLLTVHSFDEYRRFITAGRVVK